jgi:hypothetical protein
MTITHITHDIVEVFKGLKAMDRIVEPIVRRGKIHELIRKNINSANTQTHVDLRYWGHISINRALGQQVGRELALYVHNQDFDAAKELLNDNPRVRDRWGSRGGLSMSDWFNEKFPHAPDIFSCDDCMALEWDDDGFWAHDGDEHICDICINDNYTWSENAGTYLTNDEYEEEQEELREQEEEEEQNRSVIGDYHSSKRILSRIPSSFDDRKTPILMGLELEMEVRSGDYEEREDLAQDLANAIGLTSSGDRYMALESDGSLHHGFEMVTGWTGLDVHAKQLQHFKNPLRGLKSHDTQTCGLHVHICKKGMTLFHAVKMVLFINDSGNQRLVRSLARRDSSRYSQVKNKKAGYEWLKNAKTDNNLKYLNADRYEALNFQNDRTVEFRMFKGTLRYATIMACMEFTYATWFFCRDTGTNQLTTENFLEFICRAENLSDTKFLRQYLTEKNWSLPELGKIKNNPRSETPKQSVLDLATNEQ